MKNLFKNWNSFLLESQTKEILEEAIENLGIPDFLIDEFKQSITTLSKSQVEYLVRKWFLKSKNTLSFSLVYYIEGIEKEINFYLAKSTNDFKEQVAASLVEIVNNLDKTMKDDIGAYKRFIKTVRKDQSLEEKERSDIINNINGAFLNTVESFLGSYDEFIIFFENNPDGLTLIQNKEEELKDENPKEIERKLRLFVKEINIEKAADRDEQIEKEYDDGFYWYNTETDHCPVEASRMNHCGTERGTTLYSLRRRGKEYPNGVKRFVTLAKGGETIYQIKGSSNSCPKSEYWDYIVDFINYHNIKQIEETGQYSGESEKFPKFINYLIEQTGVEGKRNFSEVAEEVETICRRLSNRAVSFNTDYDGDSEILVDASFSLEIKCSESQAEAIKEDLGDSGNWRKISEFVGSIGFNTYIEISTDFVNIDYDKIRKYIIFTFYGSKTYTEDDFNIDTSTEKVIEDIEDEMQDFLDYTIKDLDSHIETATEYLIGNGYILGSTNKIIQGILEDVEYKNFEIVLDKNNDNIDIESGLLFLGTMPYMINNTILDGKLLTKIFSNPGVEPARDFLTQQRYIIPLSYPKQAEVSENLIELLRSVTNNIKEKAKQQNLFGTEEEFDWKSAYELSSESYEIVSEALSVGVLNIDLYTENRTYTGPGTPGGEIGARAEYKPQGNFDVFYKLSFSVEPDEDEEDAAATAFTIREYLIQLDKKISMITKPLQKMVSSNLKEYFNSQEVIKEEKKHETRLYQINLILNINKDASGGIEESLNRIRSIDGITVISYPDYEKHDKKDTLEIKTKFHLRSDSIRPITYINRILVPSINSSKYVPGVTVHKIKINTLTKI